MKHMRPFFSWLEELKKEKKGSIRAQLCGKYVTIHLHEAFQCSGITMLQVNDKSNSWCCVQI